MAGIRVRTEWHGDAVIARLAPARRRMIRDAAHSWFARTQAVVPLREGHLQRSGRVDVDEQGARITYPLVYARYQHERLDLKHLPGRRAKYITSVYKPEDFRATLVGALRSFFSRAR